MKVRRLYLLRHAKSSWDEPGLADHDRPLSPRGQRATAVLAEHMRGAGIIPEQVLCSSARRTRETLAGVLGGTAATIEPALYGASCVELLRRLHRVPDTVASVMLVGHNPALQTLVLRLAAPAQAPPGQATARPGDRETPLQQIAHKFPTCALATLEFDGPWSDLDRAGARLVDYVRPKALA